MKYATICQVRARGLLVSRVRTGNRSFRELDTNTRRKGAGHVNRPVTYIVLIERRESRRVYGNRFRNSNAYFPRRLGHTSVPNDLTNRN